MKEFSRRISGILVSYYLIIIQPEAYVPEPRYLYRKDSAINRE